MSRPPLLPTADPIERLPVLMLEVCDSCGCRCRMCDLWRPNPEGGGTELELDLLQSWIPGWRALGVERVGLTGGDPLLHSDIEGLLEMLAGPGFRLTLMTAGTGLDRHAGAIARWCDSVVVSLDGPPEIHDDIRRAPGCFGDLQTGVAALRERAGPSLSITARCTVQRANLGHLLRTVETARDMGLDGISFLPADTSAAAFGRLSDSDSKPLSRELCPGAGHLDGLRTELEEVARDGALNEGFVAEDREVLLERVLGHFRAEAGLEAHHARPCNAPWISAVVGVDGTVQPCFFHPASGRLHRDTDIGEVLNTPAARQQRRHLDVVNDEICRRCVCPLALRLGEDPR